MAEFVTYSEGDLAPDLVRFSDRAVRMAFELWVSKLPVRPVLTEYGDGYRSKQANDLWASFKAGFRSGEALAWRWDEAPDCLFEKQDPQPEDA